MTAQRNFAYTWATFSEDLDMPDNEHLRNASKGAGAVVSGMLDMPLDVIKYAGSGATRAAQGVGLIDQLTADRRVNQISDFADNPPFLNDNVNAYRRHLADTQPVPRAIGEIGSGFGLAAMLRNPVKYLQIMKGMNPNTTAAARSLAGATASENVGDPALDKLLKIPREE